MPVDRVTAQQIATEISTDIQSRDTSVDTAFGPVRDIVIRPVSRVMESQNERIRKAFDLLSLRNLDQIDNADLDDFVFNEGITRNQGTSASTTVIFSRVQAPIANITTLINFPLATIPDTTTGVRVQFITSQSKTMYSSSPGLYYNANTGRYELEVAVSAVNTGISGNVGSSRISIALRGLTDFDSVSNRVAATGGTDVESNFQLAQRYLLRVLGTDISTPTGIQRFVMDFFSQVQDSAVAYGTDTILEREDIDAGAVDLWVLGEIISSASETVFFPGVDQLITLASQPVRAISSVVDGVPTTYIEDIDFVFVEDTGIEGRSVRGQSGIKFIVGGASPLANAPLTITYSYNSLIGSLQSFFSSDDYFSIGRDLLFRESIRVEVVLTATLKVSTGNPTTVLNNVLTAISNFINTVTGTSGGLGNNLEEFDINREVARVQGVDNFVISQLSRDGGSGVQDLAITKNEYGRISSANLNVTLI